MRVDDIKHLGALDNFRITVERISVFLRHTQHLR